MAENRLQATSRAPHLIASPGPSLSGHGTMRVRILIAAGALLAASEARRPSSLLSRVSSPGLCRTYWHVGQESWRNGGTDSALACLKTKSQTWRNCPVAGVVGALILFHLKNHPFAGKKAFTIKDTSEVDTASALGNLPRLTVRF